MSAARQASVYAGCSGGSVASRQRVVLSADTERGPASSRCLDALIVAVNQVSRVRQWYTKAKELQLASLMLCEAWRAAHTVRLRVREGTPATLLASADGRHVTLKEDVTSRVPQVRVRRLRWQLSTLGLLSNSINAFAEVEELRLCMSVSDILEVRAWPRCLRSLIFGETSGFNQPIVGVPWPASLLYIEFGTHFNQPIEGVRWPASLRHLTFGRHFNQPIEGVTWPTSLRKLVFRTFNQPIERVTWPGALQLLTLGQNFNQPIERVEWPKALKTVNFGSSFNQPVEDVAWPASLQVLALGSAFNRPIENLTWPTSLQQLKFWENFDQPIAGVTWPPSLQQLRYCGVFNQPIVGVTWPTSLREIVLERNFDQPIAGVTWPISLHRLVLGRDFDHPIDKVAWPTSLRKLRLGRRFNQPIESVKWPPLLEDLTFGRDFNHPIQEAQWPLLQRFSLTGKFSQSLQKLGKAMPSLEQFTLRFPSDQARYRLLRGIQWPAGLTRLSVSCTEDLHLEGVSIPPSVSVSFVTSHGF